MGRKDDQRRAKAKAKSSSKKDDGKKSERIDVDSLPFRPRTGPDAPSRTGASMDVDVQEIVVFAGRQELLYNATLKLAHGHKYGLIGRNGVGKSTLLRALAEQDGRVPIPKHIMMMHVEQEITGDDTPVLDSVLKADIEREWLLRQEQALLTVEDNGSGEEVKINGVTLMEVYERLEEMSSEDAEARAAVILSGLGFSGEDQQRPTKEFSGGWRMRIALAQSLFVQPDLLLLDEPTNHLDVHAVTWLEEFLKSLEKTTIVVVSHDRSFLNECTRATIFLHRKRLWYYGGSYDTFLRVRAEQRSNQEAVQQQQQRKVSHLKQFIARFGHGHKKMAKQAQARMKMLGKLQEEAVAVDFDDPYLQLDFPAAPPLPPPCISVIDAAFGYTEDRILYKDLHFGVDCDSRIAVVGPNGAGKSTFLKLLDGSLQPTEGFVRRHAKLSLARFTQHHIESMDLDENAVTHMRRLGAGGIKSDGTSEVTIEEARKYLGRFGLQGDLALQPVKHLSGGQKSRLAFAELAWSAPHLLLLDEPTNHLDLETIEGLAMALNKFEGGVVLVSHDDRLVSMVADELWIVMPGPNKDTPGRVTVFEGSFEEYKQMLRDEFISKNLTAGGRIKRRD